nr:unnamed protein product [Digitaria exilis]
MAFATGAITSLIPKLGKLLKDEYDLQKSVKGGIKFLMLELESMQASLEKVSCVPADQLDKNAMLWARHVREMSYDIEDTVDTFLVRVEGNKTAKPHNIKGFVDRTLHLLSKARIRRNSLSKTKIRRRIAIDIQDIMDRVKEAKERRDRYNVDSIIVTPVTTSLDPRLAALFKRETDLVGIDKIRDKLISMLLGGDDPSKENLKSVSVFGIGGLGKTTLAKTVYEKLKSEFECRAFVSVGQNPDIKKVLQDILLELDKHKYENIHNTRRDEKQLIDLLREFLHNKRLGPYPN